MTERRIDPDDKAAYTWEELAAYYKGKYTKKEIEAYWEACTPVKKGEKKGEPEPKAKAKTQAKGKAKAEPKAKAKVTRPSLADVKRVLQSCCTPHKDRLWRDAQKFGKSLNSKLAPFKFIPRGGLSSPYVAHVSDVDLIFCDPGSTGNKIISRQEFLRLYDVARHTFEGGLVVGMQVCANEEELFDRDLEAHEDAADIWDREVSSKLNKSSVSGPDAVILTGSYRWSNFHLPMDISITRGNPRMSQATKCAKFEQNLEDGNFAKAVQRARSFLKNKDLKWALSSKWNDLGGRLRFLVKQFSLLSRIAGSAGVMDAASVGDYCRATLGLSDADENPDEETCEFLRSWMEAVTVEMQGAGREVLKEFAQPLTVQMNVDVEKYI